MPTPGCDCPLCVLYYADLQICDLRVVLTKKQKDKLHFTMRHDDMFAPNKEIENSIMALIYDADRRNLKVDHYHLVEKPEYTLKIERLSKNEYKFCFHSNMNPVPDEEADPLPMD
jgi:hypothetical protein